jgi:hypothetical protein
MLINLKLANQENATPFGNIKFNEKGENNDLKPEEQKILGALPGFEYKEDKKPAAKPVKEEEAPKKPAKAKE